MTTVKTEKKPVVKFISEYTNGFGFVIEELDDKGQPVWVTDREGAGKVIKIREFHFTKIIGKDPITAKASSKYARHMFACDPDILGDLYDRILAKLNKMCCNPDNKLYTEDNYQKKVNLAAYTANARVRDLEGELTNTKEELNMHRDYIKELEAKLGLSLTKEDKNKK